MKNWNTTRKLYYKGFCRSERGCRKSRRLRVDPYQIDANQLHQRMPYVWRGLDNKTRRKIIRLAKRVPLQ